MSTNTEACARGDSSVTIFRDAPDWDGMRCAAIGDVRFSDEEAGAALLNEIADDLQQEGFHGLLGPMNGDTWHSYRLVTETDGAPPFFMEPTSSPHDLSAFMRAGFHKVSDYVSARGKLEDALGAAPVSVTGISVSCWDGTNTAVLIEQLFAMSKSSFSQNNFYKPISRKAFLALYEPFLPFIDPKHVLFARDDEGAIVGFLFATPDHLCASGNPSVILKTYASAQRGVGRLLADTYHRLALKMGFETVIHALMHQDNISRTRSDQHSANIFRRYALMGRKL